MGEFRAPRLLSFGARSRSGTTLSRIGRSLIGRADRRASIDDGSFSLPLRDSRLANLDLALAVGALELGDLRVQLRWLFLQLRALGRLLRLPLLRSRKPLLRVALSLSPVGLFPCGCAQPLAVSGALARFGCSFGAFIGNGGCRSRCAAAGAFNLMFERR